MFLSFLTLVVASNSPAPCPALCILAEGSNIRLHEEACKVSRFYTVPLEPSAEDADAARAFRLLATAAQLANGTCDWTLIVPDSSFVNAAALMRRLSCFDQAGLKVEPLVFARMAGRLALNFVYDRGQAVRFGTLRGGVVVNKAALALVASDAGLYDWEAFARLGAESVSLLQGKPESHSVDDVGFNRLDFIFTMYWWRRFSIRVENWASYMDQYIIGADVERRLDVRSRILGMPCVLVAHPVDIESAAINRHVTTCCQDVHCKTIDVGAMTYSWLKQDQSSWETESFIPDRIKGTLDQCIQSSERAGNPCLVGNTIEYEPLVIKSNSTRYIEGVQSVIVLSPPGGGTSWIFHKVKESVVEPAKMVVEFDLFQPYCNDKLRVELSQVFGAGEDESKYHLVSEKIPITKSSLLPIIFDLVSKGKTVVTKEVMNIFRILDLHELNEEHHILFLFRSRHHTFPSSEAVCRTCFFAAFHESFVAQNFTIPWLQIAKELLQTMHPDAMLTHVLVHTTLWRYVLFKLRLWGCRPRFLKYADMMRSSDPTLIISEAWNFDGRLNAIIDFDRLGRSVSESRQSREWLDARERKYLDLDVEHMVKGFLSILEQADPQTDVNLLLFPN